MHLLLKLGITGLSGALAVSPAFPQATVRIDSFPQNLQLYQRGPANLAQVAVRGNAPIPYTQVSLRVLRSGALYYYQKQVVGGTTNSSLFSFTPSLRAEAVEYDFSLYGHTSPKDSVLVGRRERIVCGDLLVLYGQSNVLALHDIDGYAVDDRLLRNFSYPYLSANIANEVSWSVAKQPYASVGGIGLWLQKLILDTYGIPTCVINGGVGGASIRDLSVRDPSDPTNLNTYYGQLLYRVRRAGLADKARLIVYKQGEADAGVDNGPYGAALRKMTDQFEEDYPAVRKIYVSQINILPDPIAKAGEVRDAQRRAKQQPPLIETIATVGTPAYDGIHYLRAGNQQIAAELFRQMARDFYGAADTVQINSPNLKNARYNARRDTITLTFDESMRMVWPRDTTLTNAQGNRYTRRMVDFMYLDGQPGAVTSGFARRNEIVLALRQPATAQTVTYLPPFFSDANSPFYNGVYLKNERGLRAFSFDKVPILVVGAPKLTQSISMPTIDSRAFSSAPVTLTALASSDLPVTYRVVSGPATLINSHQIRLTGIGPITLSAVQPGDERYLPATAITRSFTISKGSQQIGEAITTTWTGQSRLAISATASSGLPIGYKLLNGPATLQGAALIIGDLGEVTLQLSQPGDDRYLPAPDMIRTICLNPERPTISTDLSSELLLVSSSQYRNQWFLDGDAIPEQTGQKLMVNQDGTYVVKVTNPVVACKAIEQSLPKQIITLATNPFSATSLRIYPNPTTDQVRILLTSGSAQLPTLQLMDGNGRLLYDQLPLKPTFDGYETTFSVRSLQSGVYVLRATTQTGPIISRLLVCP